ncbi:hypothetical protein OG698_13105 [Streptomyces sp. NBC_01003]|uniref:hypothetical protein n=1 Tax=Streptomyces sp. NBC_01003 TaxID=2903714 RepID=UPI00387008A2|nr:hypothetical protein OG698_13105 [Streptomyces sp. NBC_01003]
MIHHPDGNAPADARTRFVVAMLCAPDKPLLELLDKEQLNERLVVAMLCAPDKPLLELLDKEQLNERPHLCAPRPTD